MTTIEQATPTEITDSRREARRREIAELLDRDPATLPDTALLTRDLGLDSLDMMSVLTWLEDHGVRVDHTRPTSVGELLSLTDQAAAPEVFIRVTNRMD